MSPLRVIIRKELADHFSSARFLILLSLVFMVALVSANMVGAGIEEVLAGGGGVYLKGRLFLLLFTSSGTFFSLISFLAFFGPLIGLLLGFDSVNRERNQGTLSKIMAQPIYRDEFILGKYLAGLITLSIMVVAMVLLVSGFGLALVGVIPTWPEILRVLIFILLSVVYLGIWLGLSIYISINIRSVATSALAAVAVWIFMAFFVAVIGGAVAGFIHPGHSQADQLNRERTYKDIMLVSPVNLYAEASLIMLDPIQRDVNQAVKLAGMNKLNKYLLTRFQGPLPASQSLIIILPHIILLVGLSALIFWLAYLSFVKQEIRSV